MSTSRPAFSQVKDILKKLDQSIDAAREKRKRDEGGPAASRPAPGRAEIAPARDGVDKPHASQDSPGHSHGRATPTQSGNAAANPFTRRVG